MPVPASINKIEEKTKALKRYTKSFEIAIRNDSDPWKRNTETGKAIAYRLKQAMQQMKSFKFVETLSMAFEKITQDGPTTKTAYLNSSPKTVFNVFDLEDDLKSFS